MVNSPEIVAKRLMDEIDNQLNTYLAELDSPETPFHITSVWITEQLPNISTSHLRDWIRDGIISPELGPPGRGRYRLFTQGEAKMIGHIWYFRKKGHPLAEAVAKANKFLLQFPHGSNQSA